MSADTRNDDPGHAVSEETQMADQRTTSDPQRSIDVGVVITDVVLIGTLVFLLPQTLDLSAAARRFPLATIVVIIALLLLDLAMTLSPWVRRRLAFLESGVTASAELTEQVAEDQSATEQEPEHDFRRLNLTQAIIWLVALGLAMAYLGYLVASPLFLLTFYAWARVPWKVAVGVTAVTMAVLYFGFHEAFRLK